MLSTILHLVQASDVYFVAVSFFLSPCASTLKNLHTAPCYLSCQSLPTVKTACWHDRGTMNTIQHVEAKSPTFWGLEALGGFQTLTSVQV